MILLPSIQFNGGSEAPMDDEYILKVRKEAIAIAVVLDPPYDDLVRMASCPEGQCPICDAYRLLYAMEDEEPSP